MARAEAIYAGETGKEDESSEAYAGDVERYVVFPLFAYIHSGVTLSLGEFSCRWDSGQIGWLVVDLGPAALFLEEAAHKDKESILTWIEECGEKREKARQRAKATVEMWNQYLSGDVWGYVVYKIEMCSLEHKHRNIVDSCWGYYGKGEAELEGAASLKCFQEDGV